MKRNIVFIPLLIVFVLITTSCFSPSEAIREKAGLKTCGSLSLLPSVWCDDTRCIGSDIIEKDEYGRILFEFRHLSDISGESLHCLVICQINDYGNECVYYYEDMNFLIYPYSTEELEHLKQINDWNKPLDYSKMSKREYRLTHNLHFSVDYPVERREAVEAIVDYFDIDRSFYSEYILLDALGNQQLAHIIITRNGVDERYIVYMETGGKNIHYLKIENDTVDYAAYRQFKIDCGWAYP